MSVIFLHPLFLFLIAVLPLLWVMARRPVDMGQVFLRGLLLLLVILALAKPVIFDAGTNKHHIFVVDLTDSLSTEQKQEAVEALDSLIGQVKAGDRHTTLVMGGVAGIRDEPGFKDAVYLSSSNRSSLSAALKEAVESIPVGGRGAVSLLTDGRATDQNWADALRAIQDRKIPVHILDLAQAQDDIFISGLTVDGDFREGQTSTLFVEISGSGEGLRVEIYADDQLWATSVEFDNEGTGKIAVNVEPKRQGFVSIEAKLIVPAAVLDKDKSNNNLRDLVAVAPPLRLLYLGERQRQGAEKLQELLGAGFSVSEAKDRPLDRNFPIDSYDLVVIDDRPARALPEAFQAILKKAVRENGLGVFFAGGRSAFGEGGYKGTEIEKMLPVEFRRRDEKKDPSVSLALVIDTSGSMLGQPIELAKHVAKLAIGRLKPHDMVGVVEFYGNKQWAVPLQSAANKVEIDRAISRMQADGSTNLYPAVEEAYYGLKNMKTRFKHLLIIIDGDMGAEYEDITRRMVKDGITVSTVLVGSGLHHQEMFDMASWGRGRFYTVGNRFNLVDVILKREQTTKMPAYYPGQHKVASRTGPGWIGDVEPLADVRGYVETKMKPAGELLLEIGSKKHPLLASWRYGLGRVTSMMTEPLGYGTSSWQKWPEYGVFLGRILSRTASDMDAFAYEIVRKDFDATVTARRTGRDRNIIPVAWMLDEVTSPKALTFRQRSPDLYEANFQIPHERSVRIEAVSRHVDEAVNYEKSSRKYRLASAAYDGVAAERQVSSVNGLDMGRLRLLSGGEALDRDSPVLSPSVSKSDDRSLSVRNIWPYLLLLAILIYLLELFYRRWPGLKFRGNG